MYSRHARLFVVAKRFFNLKNYKYLDLKLHDSANFEKSDIILVFSGVGNYCFSRKKMNFPIDCKKIFHIKFSKIMLAENFS